MSIIIKNAEQIEGCRAAAKLVATAHQSVRNQIRAGISTYQVENIVKHILKDANAKSAFYKYTGGTKKPFPGHICISVNEEVVHGIASHSRTIKEGDIVSVDIGCILNGYYGDAAESHAIGEVSHSLVADTSGVLLEAIEMTKAGVFLFDISKHFADSATRLGYGNVINYFGHGVGLALHEPPTIPNYVPAPGTMPNVKLQEGMIVTYEPMFTLGTGETKELDDGWTVVTSDSSVACHQEHTILILKDRAEILTKL